MIASRNWGRSVRSIRFGAGLWFCLCASCFCIALSGCSSSLSGEGADEQEPHYILGENRINAMDYHGAVRAFEESLEADPHSAAAHFQLAWLYDAKVSDPAAAIYHYEKYIELEPDAGNAAVVRQRIEACKQKLAEDVLALPSMPAAQQRIHQMTSQLQQLQDENRQLEKKNQQLQACLNHWSARFASLHAALSHSSAFVQPLLRTVPAGHSMPVKPNANPGTAQATSIRGDLKMAQAFPTTVWRTHMVVPGETAVRIARHYGISLEALLSANPGLEPRRMPVGLILNIPAACDASPPFLAARR